MKGCIDALTDFSSQKARCFYTINLAVKGGRTLLAATLSFLFGAVSVDEVVDTVGSLSEVRFLDTFFGDKPSLSGSLTFLCPPNTFSHPLHKEKVDPFLIIQQLGSQAGFCFQVESPG